MFFLLFFRGVGNQYAFRMYQLQDSKAKHKIQVETPPGVVIDVAILVAEGLLYSVRPGNHKTSKKAHLIGVRGT